MIKKSFIGLFVAFQLFGIATWAQDKTRSLQIDDVLKYSFYPFNQIRGFNPMKNGANYSAQTDAHTIGVFEYASGEKKKEHKLQLPHNIEAYAFSQDEQKILLTTQKKQIYRHSYTAQYWIYDISTKQLTALSERGTEQLATFSPNGQQVAFVRNNNLFVTQVGSQQEQQITTDGKFNHLINGAPDWVYEEEFGFSKAFKWSPNGKYIAYYKFDESKVKQFQMQKYDGLYPSVYQFKYPKAGEDNSVVSIHVYELASGKTTELATTKDKDTYIPRIWWGNKGERLYYAELNRLQNKMKLQATELSSLKTQTVYSEQKTTYYDYKHLENLRFLPDNKSLVLSSNRNGYCHLYRVSLAKGHLKQLTHGAFDITKFYGYSPEQKRFFYQAAAVSPMQREVYSVNAKGKKVKRLTPKDGTNAAMFSGDFSQFIHVYSTANQPHISVLRDISGKKIRDMKDNKPTEQLMKHYNWQNKNFFQFKTSEDTILNGWIIKPPHFDSSKKYPVFMYQYSGPNSQSVLDTYGGFTEWFQLLAQKGYIVACVDGRGTGARGEAFCKITYKNLGKYEATDQIEAAKYFQSLPYVDKNRIGIFGWSYGGYMSTLCLLKGNDVFKSAIAVAPVTNWRYYDNIYTERYMQRPQDNALGYDSNSPMHFADRLKGNYLLIHGTGDDNVHVVNAIEMSKALIEHGKTFDYMLYPNENHRISSTKQVRYHLFKTMTDFVLNKL